MKTETVCFTISGESEEEIRKFIKEELSKNEVHVLGKRESSYQSTHVFLVKMDLLPSEVMTLTDSYAEIYR